MKKLTVTVAISAKNEHANILSLLKSVLSQNHKLYTLNNVIVVSDGSTDGTVRVVKKLKSSLILLKEYGSSLGKAKRLSQIYHTLTSDLVVQLDADINLNNNNFIDNLIEPFTNNEKVGMVGANSLPAETASFVSKAIASSTRPYVALRLIAPSLSVGPVIALRSELAKNIQFPKGIIGEDIYTYFTCLTLGYKYIYAKKAVLNYVLPQDLSEHISQNVRFLMSPITMIKYFDRDLIKREDYIPKFALLSALSKEFFAHPILASYIFMINTYCRLRVHLDQDIISNNWSQATTTKKINL